MLEPFRAEQPLASSARSFDVLCVGEPRWQAARLRGAVSIAASLAVDHVHVALASAFPDTSRGRAMRAGLTARGVDVDAVAFADPTHGLVFVKGGARQSLSFGDVVRPIEVPDSWSSQVLLLSGLTPFVAHGAVLCKIARAARRAGTSVVVDLNVDWLRFQGHDSRTIRMVLREADVVFCSAADLFGMNMDLATLRAALRDTAVLVLDDGARRVSAIGAFGVVSVALDGPPLATLLDEGDTFVAAICAELARPGPRGGEALWARALSTAQATVRRRRET